MQLGLAMYFTNGGDLALLLISVVVQIKLCQEKHIGLQVFYRSSGVHENSSVAALRICRQLLHWSLSVISILHCQILLQNSKLAVHELKFNSYIVPSGSIHFTPLNFYILFSKC